MSDVDKSEAQQMLDQLAHKSDKLFPLLVGMTRNPIEALGILAITAAYITMNNLAKDGTDTDDSRKAMFLEFYNLLITNKA